MNIAVKKAKEAIAEAVDDLGEVSEEVRALAEAALAAQLIATSKKALGVDTSLEDSIIAATYQNLAVAGSLELSQKINGLFRSLAETAAHAVFQIAASA